MAMANSVLCTDFSITIVLTKWVYNPFHDDTIAIAITIDHHVDGPIGYYTTHS